MRRLYFILFISVLSIAAYSQTGTIANGESGSSVRTKLNATITKANNHADSIIQYRIELDDHHDSITDLKNIFTKSGTNISPTNAGDDILLPVTTGRMVWGDGDTYIYEVSDDWIRIYAGDSVILDITYANSIWYGDMIPSVTKSKNVGNGSYYFDNAYFDRVYIDSSTVYIDVTGTGATKEFTFTDAKNGTKTMTEILADIHSAVTLNASATTGGLSLSTQEISFRAATSSQTGYATAEHIQAIEANTSKNTNVPTALSVGTNTTTELSITSDGGADDVTLPLASSSLTGVINSATYDAIVASTGMDSTWDVVTARKVTGVDSLMFNTQTGFIEDNDTIKVVAIGSEVWRWDQTGASILNAREAKGKYSLYTDTDNRITLGDTITGNISTALSEGTRTATTYGITSDGGSDDIALPEATTDYAGLLGADKYDEIVANTAKETNTDDQTIDVFSGSGNTISLSLESDGEANQTLDISSFTAIAANTSKETNVPTALSVGTNTTTELSITSDGGADDLTLPLASTSLTGVINSATFDAITANSAKNTNVPTALSTGTVSSTTYGITSDGGTDDVVIAAATTDAAGVLTADLFDEIDANTAKETNTDDQTAAEVTYDGTETVEEILDDIINSGVLDEIVITDAGGLDITWAAGEVWDGTALSVIDTDAGSGTCVTDVVNYLYWDRSGGGTTLTLSTTKHDVSDNDVAVGIIVTQNDDIFALRQVDILSQRESDINAALRDIFKVVVTDGLVISENSGGVAFDVSISAGTFYQFGIERNNLAAAFNTTTTPMTRWYHSGGAWAFDTNAQIEADTFDNGTNRVGTVANQYYKSIFMYSENMVHWIYPRVGYSTIAQAIAAPLPAIPTVGNYFPRVMALVMKGDRTTLPTAGTTNWIDIRPLISSQVMGIVTDHGNLAGLTDDDHTQYGALAQAETITENWVNTTYPWADNEIASASTWNALVTNATHTGDVTGATALTIAGDSVNDTHINWGTGTNQVSAVDIPIADGGDIISATDVEAALQEHRTAINLNTAKNTNVSDTVVVPYTIPWAFTDSAGMKASRDYAPFQWTGPDTLGIDSIGVLSVTAGTPNFTFNAYANDTLNTTATTAEVIFTTARTVGAASATIGNFYAPSNKLFLAPKEFIWIRFLDRTTMPENGATIQLYGTVY